VLSIPNGVPRPVTAREASTVRQHLGLKASDIVWITTAFFEPRKGHAVLAEAIKALAAGGRLGDDVKFVLIGDGPEKSAVEKAVKDAGLNDRVLFLGYRPDAADMLNAADGMILPSIHSEDMPLIVLDAMALGKPVIASSLPGIAEEVDHGVTGLLTAPGNAGELAEAVAALSADPSKRAEMGRAGRMRFEQNFEVARAAESYSELYWRLLN
jgi:glycosyltransferase involved in cell wall biosynthesis